MNAFLKLAEDYGKIIDSLREENERLGGLLRSGLEILNACKEVISISQDQSGYDHSIPLKVELWEGIVEKELAE